MHLPFSHKIIEDWKIRGITNVSFFLIPGGCAGEKVVVTYFKHPETDSQDTLDGIVFHFRKEETYFFQQAKLTEVLGKWIVSNKDLVLVHCGCGSSFKRKTGNPIMDKAEAIRLALKKSQSNHHT